MKALAQLPLLGRFKKILRGISVAVGNRGRWQTSVGPVLPSGVLEIACTRLRRLELRFVRLVELYDAGKLRPLPTPGEGRQRKSSAPTSAETTSAGTEFAETNSAKAGSADAESPAAKSAGRNAPAQDSVPEPEPKKRKPRPEDFGVAEKFGWVTGLGLHPGASWMGTFDELVLRDPELQAKIAAEPRRFGRILRPLCFMLGISERPDVLRLPGEKNAEATYDDWVVDKIIAQEKALRAAGQKLWHELLNEIEPRDPNLPIKLPPRFRFYRTPFGRLLQLE